MKTDLSPVLDDQPARQDFLDFNSYVQALKELIIHDKTKTPLTLGVFGHWGMGKTTLMQMLEKELERHGLITIWFNAWQYGNEDELWAAFLQSMLNKIQNSLGPLRLPVFKVKLFFNGLKWNEIPGFLVNLLFRICISLIPILILDPVSQTLNPNIRPYIQAGGNFTAFLIAIWVVARPLVETIRKNTSIDIGDFQQKSNFQEHIAFLDKFREHFATIVRSLPQKGDKRLAVFIDDLDRCSPQQAIQVLDAIKLFVDIPGCVYILGLDVDVVQKAVASKYADDPAAQREYMSKIIQIPFQLPPLTRKELQLFLEQLTLDLPHPICQNVFITGLVVNPREVKRTINIFSLLWNLASKRTELISKIDPVRLAKVVVIQQAFPELHKLLQQRPYLLIELERYFLRVKAEKERTQEFSPDEVSEKTNDEQKSNPEALKFDLQPELIPYSQQEALRSMLLILEPTDGQMESDIVAGYGFADLHPEDVAIYFTLTNRAEAPRSKEAPSVLSVNSAQNIIGKLIGGRYEIQSELGRGGMSSVYKAYDQRLQRYVALKAIDTSLSASHNFLTRFEHEIQISSSLRHANIISILDSGIETNIPYYVMTYLPGGSLKDILERKKVLPEREIFEILSPILDALNYAHERGVVHRDIKPQSILFDENGVPYLTDFGISKLFMQTSTLTQSGIIGTPAYMSPEQAQGNPIDGRSDLYSLGILLFECVTGEAPFHAETPWAAVIKHINEPVPLPSKFNSNISVAMESVIVKLLSKKPEERFQTAKETKDALSKIFE
jgi:serine/threonine-protein kinase